MQPQLLHLKSKSLNLHHLLTQVEEVDRLRESDHDQMTERGHDQGQGLAKTNILTTKDQGQDQIRSIRSITVDTLRQTIHQRPLVTHIATKNTASDHIQMIRRKRVKRRSLEGHLKKKRSARCKHA
jgi:cell fate (sporulation/competence/biofilm development) regulator YmcA (YheA/YmcA/DUF963 family)